MTVRAAERAHHRALAEVRQLEERAKTDLTVQSVDLVRARAEADLAAARVAGAREAVEAAAAAERQALQDRGERMRQARQRAAQEAQHQGEQRAIESGAAERQLEELAHRGSIDAARKLEQVRRWRASGEQRWPGYDS